jgi:hypothetical protein
MKSSWIPTLFQKIWYKHFATGDHPDHIIFQLSTISNNNMVDTLTYELRRTLVPFNIKS